MKNAKVVQRGCCPGTAGIYRAKNCITHEPEIEGTAREIGDKIGHEANYIRVMARTGHMSKAGWIVKVVAPSTLHGGRLGGEYIAECPGEDPIVGPVDEIAALTGLSSESVRYLIRTHGKSRAGWTVREHRGFDIPPDTVVE